MNTSGNVGKISPSLQKETRDSFRLKLIKASSIQSLAKQLGVGGGAIRRAVVRFGLEEDFSILGRKSKNSPTKNKNPNKSPKEGKKAILNASKTLEEIEQVKTANPPKPIRRVNAPDSLLEEGKPELPESTTNLEQDFFHNLSNRINHLDSKGSPAGIASPTVEAVVGSSSSTSEKIDEVLLDCAKALAMVTVALLKKR